MKTKAKPAAAKHPTQKDLLAYAQDFLTAAKRAKTEAHLELCADCPKELVRVKRFLRDAQVALTPKEVSTEELMARVQKQLEERKRHRSMEDLFKWGFGAWALATTFVTGRRLHRRNDHNSQCRLYRRSRRSQSLRCSTVGSNTRSASSNRSRDSSSTAESSRRGRTIGRNPRRYP